jgi:hypothetical protein
VGRGTGVCGVSWRGEACSERLKSTCFVWAAGGDVRETDDRMSLVG